VTTQVFGDDDADLDVVQDRNVAVLGYDAEARAHALCLRDSGVDVRVGLDPESEAGRAAADDGLRVVTAYEACEEADLFVLLGLRADDSLVPEVVVPNLVPGDVVVLGSGGSLSADLSAGVNVVRVVPWDDGVAVRREYSQGRGVAMFVSVIAGGDEALQIALGYARAIGGTRAGVIATGEHEYQAALEQSRSLLHDDLVRHVRVAFDAAMAEGGSPELAYVLCVRAIEPFARGLHEGRFDSVLDSSGFSTQDQPPGSFADAARLVRALTGNGAGRRPGLD
jgi:ketol-acid reductoisomerase